MSENADFEQAFADWLCNLHFQEIFNHLPNIYDIAASFK